ncbi:hypothetical protein [Massilia sp. YMA4]|uniref:hypothetical protein n=1 Tax=Massilia sp. YMA4 TaxID=1593482 RepID=UPI000DD1827D|nr:hypothetical protein [Massilia sp. YMA4]AXA92714.1 hypothetical protein DPH57_17110 [Massilia sp. YMA4]
MKSTTKAPVIYPRLSEQPSYREALDKLNHFCTQLQLEQQKLHDLQFEYSKSINSDEKSEPEADHIIQKAEALISGSAPLQSLIDQIHTKTRLIKALEDASRAQRGIVTNVETTLSREAGQHFIAEHKAIVARILAAVEELYESNLAELNFRNDLGKLGYHSALPAMLFAQVDELDPARNSRAYYWSQDARKYLR